MEQFFSRQWVLIVGILVALTVSVLCQIIITYYMLQIVKASENPEESQSMILKDWIEEYLKEKQMITNISVYIDKKLQQLCIGKYKVTWIKHLSGQTLLLAIFLAGVGACRGIIEGQTLGQVLPFYIISLFGMYIHFSLAGVMDLEGRKKIIQMNLSNFLENSDSYLYSFRKEKEQEEVEEGKNFFGENEDLELKELIREILA